SGLCTRHRGDAAGGAGRRSVRGDDQAGRLAGQRSDPHLRAIRRPGAPAPDAGDFRMRSRRALSAIRGWVGAGGCVKRRAWLFTSWIALLLAGCATARPIPVPAPPMVSAVPTNSFDRADLQCYYGAVW